MVLQALAEWCSQSHIRLCSLTEYLIANKLHSGDQAPSRLYRIINDRVSPCHMRERVTGVSSRSTTSLKSLSQCAGPVAQSIEGGGKELVISHRIQLYPGQFPRSCCAAIFCCWQSAGLGYYMPYLIRKSEEPSTSAFRILPTRLFTLPKTG